MIVLFSNIFKPIYHAYIKQNSKVQGIIWILISCFTFSIITVIIRHLSHSFSPVLVMFYRSIIATIILAYWVKLHNDSNTNYFKCKRFFPFIMLAILGTIGMILWFYSTTIIPLPEVTALSFTVPLFTVIIAILFLNEPLKFNRFLALFIGIIGVLIIVKPAIDDFDSNYSIIFLTTFFWALYNTLLKKISKKENVVTIIFYVIFFSTIISAFFAIPIFKIPNQIEAIWLLLLGIISVIAQISHTKAVSKTELGVIEPFDFSRLLFATFYGAVFFDDNIYFTTIIGSVIIIISSVIIIKSELKSK